MTLEQQLVRWWLAIERGDMDDLQSLYASAGVSEVGTSGQVLQGVDAVIDHYRTLVERYQVRIQILESGTMERPPIQLAVLKLRWFLMPRNPLAGVLDRPLDGPPTHPPTGKATTLDLAASVMALDEGGEPRIVHTHFSLLA
jgi:hypothetical protein